MRVFSVLFAIVASTFGFCDAFGRFGYGKSLTVPGLVIDPTGFRTSFAGSDSFKFLIPSLDWTPLSTTASESVIRMTGGGQSPTRLKADLWNPGFWIYVEKGLSLKITSTECPFLTWNEGSVGENVPMPPTKWAIISFKNGQPPLFFSFQSGPGEMVIKGKPNEWLLTTTKPYVGWIRVIAPVGLVPKPTTNARSLGDLLNLVTKDLSRWIEPVPVFQGLTVTGDATGVTATWKFDKPGALIPVGALLGPIGGYPLAVKTGMNKVEMPNECGPTAFSSEKTIRIRFPLTRIPTGRSVGVGLPTEEPIATASAFDIASVCELALSNLVGFRDQAIRTTSEETLSTFLNETVETMEPHTKQKLPYAIDGTGADISAAHAFLMQALATTVSATSEANSLLTSLSWRRDTYTWQFWAPDATLTRRVGALCALAGALCPEPERRLDGALYEAGIASQRGYHIWRRRRDEIDKEPTLIEPLDALRSTLYGRDAPGVKPEAFIVSLLSELRVYGLPEVDVVAEKGEYRLKWKALDSRPMTLTLASAYPLEIKRISLFETFSCSEALGFTVVKATVKDPMTCKISIKIPTWATSLPNSVSIPRYSESPR